MYLLHPAAKEEWSVTLKNYLFIVLWTRKISVLNEHTSKHAAHVLQSDCLQSCLYNVSPSMLSCQQNPIISLRNLQVCCIVFPLWQPWKENMLLTVASLIVVALSTSSLV